MIWGKLPPWSTIQRLWAKESGSWQECYRAWVKNSGSWKLVHGPDTPGGQHGLDTNRCLLLHCDGTEGSNVFIDSGPYGFTMLENNGYVDTAIKQFGTGSIRGNGGLCYLYVTNWPFDFGTADFTIDAWIYINATDPYPYFMIIDNSAGALRFFWTANGGGRLAGLNSMAGIPDDGVSFPWAPSLDTWHHVAQVRYGGVVTLYGDGVALGSMVDTTDIATIGTTTYVGTAYNFSQTFLGNIDELRMLNGTASWTTNFTPPTNPYP